MRLTNLNNTALRRVGTFMICALFFLCFSLPAQSQVLKLPFLGMTCLFGLLALIKTRGKALAKQTWIWIAAYILYNLIWSIMGLANSHVGAAGSFRLGIIWPVVFLFMIAAVNFQRLKWIGRTIVGVLLFQILVVFLVIGNGFQFWPSLINWLIPASAVGIHWGYIHVVGHFVGAMAFTMPFAYCRFVCDCHASTLKKIGYVVIWALAIISMLATSRRIMLIVIPLCVGATLLVPFISKTNRKQLLIQAAAGAILTALFLAVGTWVISTTTVNFLQSNYDEIILSIQGNDGPDGVIKYTDGVVLNPFPPASETDPTTDPTTDSTTKPTTPSTEPTTKPTTPSTEPTTKPTTPSTEPTTKPTTPSTEPTTPSTGPTTEPTTPGTNNGVGGFVNRVEGMVSDLQGESARGKILSSVLQNWTNSPLFGVGLGAELPGYPSSTGAYEMEYVVRLYTTGIVGLLILLALMLYVGITLLKLLRKDSTKFLCMAPMAVAYLGAVVATVSNPYIFSGFDYLLMLFLPVAFMNAGFITQKSKKEK